MKVKLKNVRIAFPTLWEARSSPMFNAPPRYSATFIIAGSDGEQLKNIRDVIDTLATAAWGTGAKATLKTLNAANKVALKSGDLKANVDGFEGNFYIGASSPKTKKPLILARDMTVLEDDGTLFSGCYVNASIDIWAQKTHGGRINATLLGVQYVRDGESFSSGAKVDDSDFEDLSV